MTKERIAIVTGAGSGIGGAASIALSRAGWTVVLTGRREDRLKEVARKCDGTPALPVVADVTDQASVKALFKLVMDKFGRLDLLFNNAGISPPAVLLEDMPLETWNATVATNLTGPFLCTQEAMRMMKHQTPQGGRIINNGSIAAYVPRPNSVAYTASKHAITGLTRQTSLDGRAFDICCSQIDIGNAGTELLKGVFASQGAPPITTDGTQPHSLVDVADIGNAIVYIANLPLNTNVLFMTLMANRMPYVGRG